MKKVSVAPKRTTGSGVNVIDNQIDVGRGNDLSGSEVAELKSVAAQIAAKVAEDRATSPKVIASGIKRDSHQKGDRDMSPVSAMHMTISPALDRTATRKRPSKEELDRREVQRKIAERAVSGPASKGRAAEQVVKPSLGKPIASGVKRGRKRNVVVEREGWGIYNVKTSHLVDEFFTRKTDAIHHLEQDQKAPWSVIKHKKELKPVCVKIIIMDEEIVGRSSAAR